MKLNIILIFLVLVLVEYNLSAQRYASKKTEEITTFYIDAIVLSNDSTPRKTADNNSSVNNILSTNYYVHVNNREVIVFAKDGYKAELISISGFTIQMKTIINGKSNFYVKMPGVYSVRIISRNKISNLLKTVVV